MPTEQPYRHWVDKVREYREDVLYPKLFGAREGNPALLTPAHLGRYVERNACPVHWLTYGVLTFKPGDNRASWLYVTSGMSDDFAGDSPDRRLSGLGCEFVMETTRPAPLAIDQLHYLMAMQLIRAQQPTRLGHLLGDFDRLPVLESSELVGSQLRWLMVAPPRVVPQEASLHSGNFDFYQVVAISEAEADYARSRGSAALLAQLERAGAYPVIDWLRTEVV